MHLTDVWLLVHVFGVKSFTVFSGDKAAAPGKKRKKIIITYYLSIILVKAFRFWTYKAQVQRISNGINCKSDKTHGLFKFNPSFKSVVKLKATNI